MTWLFLLKVVNPASAYVQEVENADRRDRQDRPGRIVERDPSRVTDGPPGEGSGPHAQPPLHGGRGRSSGAGPSRWAERRRELEHEYRDQALRGGEELLRTGATVIATSQGPVHARLIRFWNGTAILDCHLPPIAGVGGRTMSLVDRRELKRKAAEPLAMHLMSTVVSVDHQANARLWGPPPPEPDRVPSPGGWAPPPGTRPGWNWVPPGGGLGRLDRMPWWIRVIYHTPFLDRFAYGWMWGRGGWDVLPSQGLS